MIAPLSDRDKLSQYFRTDALEFALTLVSEFRALPTAQEIGEKYPPLKIKYVLRTLRRARNNATCAAKLWEKASRLDSDTRKFLGLANIATGRANRPTPARALIDERIKVLEQYRKTGNMEWDRYLCGLLGRIFAACSEDPRNLSQRRAFVVAVLETTPHSYPDPDKHPDRLDDWVNTDVGPVNLDVHCTVAARANPKLPSS
jgi:hypothetical protein